MKEQMLKLIIGDKNYSSWSMRPWLLLHHAEIPFEEINVRLREPDRRKNILAHSPSGKVPALKWSEGLIWDSLAIAEFVAELAPNLNLWPEDRGQRTLARSAAAEMHSGFPDLRDVLPMDCCSTLECPALNGDVTQDIRRIVDVWKTCRAEAADEPYLLGPFGIVDAMFAPVASRFRTYGVSLEEFGDDGTAAGYRDAILAHPSVAAWFEGARQELAERR